MKDALGVGPTWCITADAGKKGAAAIWRGVQVLSFYYALGIGRPDILVETLSFYKVWRLANIALHRTSLFMWILIE